MSTQWFPSLLPNNQQTALVENNQSYSYAELDHHVAKFTSGLLHGRSELNEQRIAFFIPASLDYVTVLLGVWRAGGIAVPLNVASAIGELEHYLSCAQASLLVVNPEYQSDELRSLCKELNISIATVAELMAPALESPPPRLTNQRKALMLFTSGTTSKPKGVVHTFHSLSAQITCLLQAWEWQNDDVIPLFLPLHHIHGIINVLCCGLWAGATVHLFPKFDTETISRQIAEKTYSVFMAVPTIYVKLIHYFATLPEPEVQAICQGFAEMRLNISGSAACPVPLFNQWQLLTGQVLLERYGMTEIGMGISNPYHGERRAGAVGQPLPGVAVRLADENNQLVLGEGEPGEIQIKSDNLFLEYWQNPKATAESFVDGWFCTGDMAVIEDGYYRIMGRTSIDIIKSGGYKLSALEIEGTLLNHPAISEVAVLGLADETWGEAVTAVAVLQPNCSLNYDELKHWCSDKMSAYKIPKRLHMVEALPRNAMGKVTKPDLKTQLGQV
ncbi:acyl-CoA synthetase [Halioxenophilus sp. WMMB6]|uniref:acyl-CoA synthetase n=1 Tax=Halioxenophilus sp. WMMB6 TaxID=3073815 RepID=UPI00295E6200|nr:acyl-CoA synthetase [Halioxenophilus sp. WMMB6]